MKYTHIFFDLGLTLVSRDRAGRYKNILAQYQIEKSYQEIEMAFHLADKTFFREYPGVLGKPQEYYISWYHGLVNFYLGISLNLFVLGEIIVNFTDDIPWKAFPYTIDTLKKLRECGLKLGLISNWNDSCRKVLMNSGIDKYLDYIVVSSEVGVEKPNPEIFKKTFNLVGVDSKQCLYVGDNYYDDVRGSQAVGMDCFLINPFEKLGIEELDYPYLIKNISELPQKLGLENTH